MRSHTANHWILALTATLLTSAAQAAVLPKDVADLTRQAEQIVIGDVVGVISFWDDDRRLIKSRITIDVNQYLVGQGPDRQVLEMSGGTVGDLSLWVSVLPVFEEGDHVLLFLGPSEIRLVESYQGAYLTDGKLAARMGPGCMRIIEQTVQPLAALLEQIQQALPPGTVLPKVLPYHGQFQLPLGDPRYQLCGYDWTYQANPMGENYRINPNCRDASAGDPNSQITQICNGMDTWTNAGARFAFTYGGTSSQASVSYNNVNLIFFSTSPPDGGGYVAANYHWVSGSSMVESDIVLNDRDYTWWNGSGSCGGGKMDIWNICAHELGHTLCLRDLYGAGDTEKTMYGYVSYCEIKKRTLHSDDVGGIIAIYGAGDTMPPTPNPMTFEIPPYAASTTSIAMRATLASDASPPVQYEFDFVSGGPGGTDSGWQLGRDYTDTGLSPNQLYAYRVRARDSASPPNVTQWSAEASAYTLASVPGAPMVGNPTSGTLELDVNPADNPPGTQFAIRCANSSDPAWNGLYVDGSGHASAAAVWQTDEQWGTIRVVDLLPETEYCFHVKARNGDLIETAFSAQSCASTLAPYLVGDVNCDGAVDFGDINPFVLAMTDPDAYAQQYPYCPFENRDINGDGKFDFGDINPFVALLAGGR